MITQTDRDFINYVRGASVLRVVLVHLGLGWFWLPYSSYVGIFFPLLFFASGAVSYYSLSRSASTKQYAYKRIKGIMLPFYVFMIPAAALGGSTDWYLSQNFLSWLFLSPSQEWFIFPIGHIWFIHCLLVMALLSIPLFSWSRTNSKVLSWTFVLCTLLAVFSNKSFYTAMTLGYVVPVSGYLLYETASLSFFYFGGAYFISNVNRVDNKSFLLFGALSLVFWLLVDIINTVNEMHLFAKERPLTYLMQSCSVIILFIGLREKIVTFCKRVTFINVFLMHFNKHAFSVFMLHIPILASIEYVLDWQELGGRPLLALARLAIVVVLTALLCIPLTFIHKQASGFLDSIIFK